MEDLREAVGEEDMAAIQKAVERIGKAFAEVRGTASSAVVVAVEASAKTKKGRKGKTADGEEKVKREVKPGSWADQLKTVYSPIFNEAWGSDKKPAGMLMKVAGYLKKEGKVAPTVEEMREAIKFITENPEHKSDTQISRSAAGSTDEAPKVRGRPKKVASEAPKKAEVIAKLEAMLSDDEDSDDDDDDEEEVVKLVAFEYKGNNYLKDTNQEVYTAEGELQWVGTFNGKKITKGDMPARVKKYIDSSE